MTKNDNLCTKLPLFLRFERRRKGTNVKRRSTKTRFTFVPINVFGGGSIHDYANEYCDLSISYPGLFFDNDMTHVMWVEFQPLTT